MNFVFGVGTSAYVKGLSRDTFGYAMKATNAVINGKDVPLKKDPATDSGLKRSAQGKLAVCINSETGEFYLIENANEIALQHSVMMTVFENGQLMNLDNFNEVRERFNNQLYKLI